MKRSTRVRLTYALGFVLTTVLAGFCMAEFTQDTLAYLIIGDEVCPDGECGLMYGYLGVMRLTFALALYHLVLCVFTLGVKSSRHSRAKLHNSQWGLKFILLLVLVFSVWFIPNDFYLGASYFALAFAFIFALAQFFLLVSFADSINLHLVGAFEETEQAKYMVQLIGLSVLFGGLALTLIVLLFAFYCGGGCGVNIFMTAFTLAFIVIPSVLSVTPFVQERKHNIGLFQSLVVGCYASYLTWIGISGYYVGDECNSLGNEHAASLISLVPGAVFLAIALCYWTVADVNGSDEYAPLLDAPSKPAAADAAAPPAVNESDEDPEDDEVAGAVYVYSRFHFVMAAAALYLAMIITGWETLEKTETGYQLTAGQPALWLKWSAGAISLLLYTFSLVAPLLFPDRDFN